MRRAAITVVALAIVLAGCSRPESGDVEVEVRSVGLDNLSHSPVVVLQDKAHRTALPIWIGANEAQAIAMQLEGVNPPRPMTHDLMRDLLVQSGVDLQRVVIGDLKDRTYFARIHLANGRREVAVDSRPSDAIALAVRLKKPIFVARSLMTGEAALDVRQTFGADTVELRGITVQEVSADLAEILEIDEAGGVLVSGVGPGTAELRRGDVIVAVNGTAVGSLADFVEAMEAGEGEEVRLRVAREGEDHEVALPAP